MHVYINLLQNIFSIKNYNISFKKSEIFIVLIPYQNCFAALNTWIINNIDSKDMQFHAIKMSFSGVLMKLYGTIETCLYASSLYQWCYLKQVYYQ